MKLSALIGSLTVTAFLCGCAQKTQDAALEQGRVAFAKASDFATGAWKSACDSADKLSADSGRPALAAAQSQLESAKAKLEEMKDRSPLEGVKMESVQAEIERIRAALDLQKLKAEMDERVESARKAKENAEKNVQDVRDNLVEADANYRDLQKKVGVAQALYDSAAEKVKSAGERLQSL